MYSNRISEREWLPYGELDYRDLSGITHLNSYDNLFDVNMSLATRLPTLVMLFI